ncbi:hypothetical protein CP532_1493 [Ophiocordyceps camponoti-leonardi (nom. inval.)]|nr:hypothetical protein CP532_1493 [Ophiocordyceps camponoti-leonardi (nom. inval.)]
MPRPKRARREQLPVASSSTASNDQTVRRRGRPRKSTAPSLADETVLGAARRKRDAALDTLAKEDPTSSVAGERGRGVAATPLRRGHRDSGLDLADDDVFGALDDEFADDDSLSSPAAGGDRRRPRSRQSSIVGPNDPPIRPSSRGPNTPGIGSSLNIGLFRRRPREPSILGTSRKPLPARNGEVSDKSSDVETDEERTTPSLLSKSRKRKSEGDHDDDGDDGDDGDENARENPAQDSSSLSDVIDSDSELSILASPPLTAPAFLSSARPVTPTNSKGDDEVAAPPASSGSESDADAWPDIHGLAKRRRRPSALVMPTVQPDGHHDPDDGIMSSPPSLTHSPNLTRAPTTTRRGGRTRRRRAPSPPKLTTAHLTNLLPKRRQRKRARYASHSGSDEELDTTDLAPDEDELTYLDVRSRRGARRPHGDRTGSSSGQQGEGSVLKPRQTASSTRQPRAAKTDKAHTRRSSDKENENDENEDEDDEDEEEGEGESALVPLPDNTFDSTPDAPNKAPPDELKKAARKFKEVDKWELEFEEVTASSSSQDAR